MRKTARRILPIALGGATILFFLLLLLAAVRALKWPLWAGFFLLLAVAGIVCFFFFLRQFWLARAEGRLKEGRKREKAGASGVSGRAEDDLEGAWRRGVEILRSSDLKKQGHPLYLLPWYLMLGATGTGKTTSLRAGPLPSPLTPRDPALPGEPTAGLQWWFLDQAVVIDTAGRLSLPAGQAADDGQWQKFLRLLAGCRRREPLNGAVLTVSVDRLRGDGDLLAAEGRSVRRRLEELMGVLGVRFPVYLLVTKCDLVEGFQEFVAGIPEDALRQALGVINPDPSGKAAPFLKEALASLHERLRDLRLVLLLQSRESRARRGLTVFPERLGALEEGLALFAEAALGYDRYREAPMLRGIFFCSGLRETVPLPRLAASCGVRAAREPEARTGIFLHDLFTRILPGDRWLFAPTGRALRWRDLTGNLGLVSCLILGFGLCGLLSFSFLKNLSIIRQVPLEFSHPPQMRGESQSDLAAMEAYRREIAAVEERNRHWWLPRFGLTTSLQVEGEMKRRFCRGFRDGFLAFLDRRLADTLSAPLSQESYPRLLLHLARRINLLKGRREGAGYEALKGMPQPGFPPLAGAAGPAASYELKERFNTAYLCYLAWGGGGEKGNGELPLLQESFKRLLAVQGGDLRWLLAWVDRESGVPAVTLADFWGEAAKSLPCPRVAPAFTRQGGERMESLLREIEAPLGGKLPGEAERGEFKKWRRLAAFAAWESFAAAFPRGAQCLKGEREWRERAPGMATEDNPYFALLSRIALELEPEIRQGDLPPWLQQLCRFQVLRSAGTTGGSGVFQKAGESGRRMLAELESRAGKEESFPLKARLAASQAYGEYRSALAAIAPATLSRGEAYRAAAQLFSEDPAVGRSPFITASAAKRKLAAALAGEQAANQTVAGVVGGPLDFLWRFVGKEASGHLQNQWEEQVLAGSLGMPGQQSAPLLLGPDGLVWKFVQGPAAPFVSRTLQGYRPKEVLGNSVEFEGAFFSFLQRGTRFQAAALGKQSSYGVGIRALPTDVNPDARLKPQATRLELQCGPSSQLLVNQNYPVARTFNWSPDNCGEVLFQIEVGELALARRFPGPQGFVEFLQAFPGGEKTFHPRDFPAERAALEKLGIRYIRVNYQFTGSGEVLRQAVSACGVVPRSIAKCF